MPETLTDRNKCHKCHKTGKRKKDKLSKCSKCHSITYCSQECQEEDWPRHSDNCIPVMMKEYGEKGQGLVAAKDIKMGELILTDQAVVSNDDINKYFLKSDAERLLINRKILKDISLLNHSCAPNAAMGLLDVVELRKPEKRFELRAIKDISKDEEVTIFYQTENSDVPPLEPLAVLRETIREDYGFDCKCPVCSGEVPNQDDIIKKIWDIMDANKIRTKGEGEMTPLDWTREAITFGAIVELYKPVYIGNPMVKMNNLGVLARAARKSRKEALLEKALDGIKELAEKTGLEVFKHIEKDELEVFKHSD